MQHKGVLLAVVFFVAAFPGYGDDATNYLSQGIIKGRQGDYAGAYADFNTAISLKPDYVQAYNERGLATGALAKNARGPDDPVAREAIDRAIADYSKAVEIDATYAPAYYNRGVAMVAKGDRENAKSNFTTVTKLKADVMLLSQAYLHLGELREGEGDKAGAAYCFSAAYFYRANSEVVKQETNSALADFNKAIELRPDFATAFYNRGRLKETMGDFNGALADDDTAIKLDPSWSEPFMNRGNVRLLMNDTDGALADFNSAIALNPKSAKAMMNRGRAYARLGDTARAKADFSTAVEMNPEIKKLIEVNGYSVDGFPLR
jgi:tetratricopeptide (TPR) repeat protein